MVSQLNIVVEQRLGNPTVLLQGGRLALLTDRWQVRFWRDDAPAVKASMDVAVEDGRLVCQRVEMTRVDGAPGISSTDLRSIPIGRMMAHSVKAVAYDVQERDDGRLELSARTAQTTDEEVHELSAERKRPGRPRGDSISRMVDSYRRALDDKTVTAPRDAVAKELGYSNEYVGKRLSIARSRGLLGPAPGNGQAGEVR
jgi:hypothetical protein